MNDPEFPLSQPVCPVDPSHRIAGRGPSWGAVEWRCMDCSGDQLAQTAAWRQAAEQQLERQLVELAEQHRQAIAGAFGIPLHLQAQGGALTPWPTLPPLPRTTIPETPHGLGSVGLSQVPWASFFAHMRELFGPLVKALQSDRKP